MLNLYLVKRNFSRPLLPPSTAQGNLDEALASFVVCCSLWPRRRWCALVSLQQRGVIIHRKRLPRIKKTFCVTFYVLLRTTWGILSLTLEEVFLHELLKLSLCSIPANEILLFLPCLKSWWLNPRLKKQNKDNVNKRKNRKDCRASFFLDRGESLNREETIGTAM